MAVIANKVETALQLKVRTGVDNAGNDIIATQTYRSVKGTTSDSDIYDIASVIGSLETTPTVSILKQENYELVNQA